MYTMAMNLLNFPAGILMVDRETEEDQAALESYPTPCVELKWFKEVRNAECRFYQQQSVVLVRPWIGNANRPGKGCAFTST